MHQWSVQWPACNDSTSLSSSWIVVCVWFWKSASLSSTRLNWLLNLEISWRNLVSSFLDCFLICAWNITWWGKLEKQTKPLFTEAKTSFTFASNIITEETLPKSWLWIVLRNFLKECFIYFYLSLYLIKYAFAPICLYLCFGPHAFNLCSYLKRNESFYFYFV